MNNNNTKGTTMSEHADRMRQLRDDLAPLEVAWEPWDWGRFSDEGLQHVRRDGSVIVITDDTPDDPAPVAPKWLVGFYTADQFAAPGLHDDDASYVYCDSTDDLLLAIIDYGQAHSRGPWSTRFPDETDAAYAERCLRNGTMQP